MRIESPLARRGPRGSNLFECVNVACVDDVRCARLLFSAIRAVCESTNVHDINSGENCYPNRLSREDADSSSEVRSAQQLRLTRWHIGGALHVCCPLGHVEMVDYLLGELS